MSNNASEIDEITGQVTSLGRKVHHVISAWRRSNPTAKRVPRNVRREINHLIRSDNRAREFMHAQERSHIERRVIEYRWNLLRDREVRAWDTQSTWFERQRQLAIEHQHLRASLYSAPHLTATERGRAERVLTAAHHNPRIPVGRVFRTGPGLDALKARVRDGFTRLRAGWTTNPTEQRRMQQWQQLHRERAERAPYGLDRSTLGRTVDVDQFGTGGWVQQAEGEPYAYRLDAQEEAALRNQWRPPGDTPAQPRPATAQPAEQPKVSVEDLTQRINLYREAVRYRSEYAGDKPEEMRPFDRDNARMRDRIIADARQLGPDQAALADIALNSIEQLHRDTPARSQQRGPVERGQEPQQRGAATQVDHETAAPVDNEPAVPRYEVAVATSKFKLDHADMVQRIPAATFAEARDVVLDRLADDKQGWPADAELNAHIFETGETKPLYGAVGTKDVVIDKVVGWQAQHDNSPLGRIEQLQDQLRAARAENDRLRVENTGLVRKFADHDPTQNPAPKGLAPQGPAGPRLAKPVFAGPVISQPVMNGLDR
ncbi:hypothetical protein [Nocardia wallacei]|uniref:hypothetical protein n=1 Tax=Nocardia wallacei TaxID=480035 RepID=UPI0024578EB9|nr:hypothetical protein [Nocardia wallacei]